MGKMETGVIKEKIRAMIEPLINDLGMELDDLELNRMQGKALLRVYIEKEEGITLGDCEQVSREIEAVLDVEDPIPYSYVLEVSSPGLDRPLRAPQHFKRFAGSSVRVVTREPLDRQTFFEGVIAAADDESVLLHLPGGREVTIPYGNISKARLAVEV